MGWVSTERNHDEQPITVGVIDDDPMICQMMRLILEDYSSGRISVAFACTNAADAIEHASHNPPDVVLADIAMPGMDGIEATRQLRMLPDPPHVLILTSLSPNNTVERAIEAGAEGFVSKTDAPEDILRDDSLPAQVMPQCPKRRHLAVHRRRADVRFFGAVENPFTNVLGAQLRRVERRLVDSQPRQKPFDVAAVVADSERGVTAFGFEVCQEFGEHLRQRYNYFAGK